MHKKGERTCIGIMAAFLTMGALASVSAAGKAEPAANEIAKYTAIFDYNVDPKGMSLKDNEYITFLEQQTGVRIEIESPGSSGYSEKINVLMASGSYPDLFALYAGERNTILRFAKDGLLADLAPYINDTAKYPNIKKFMPPEAFLPVTEGQKIWAFPYNRQDGLSQVVYINKVWLDKLGLAVPKTLDEYYNVMKAFRERDPDGNGQKDTWGLLLANQGSYGRTVFKAPYQADTYTLREGKITPPEITEGYRNYLKFLARLVENEIADPEFPTFTTPIFLQKLASGKYGITSGFWHYARGTEVPAEIMNQYVAIDPPLAPNGSRSAISYESTNRHFIVIPKSTKNLDKLMKFLDWGLSPAGTRFTYLGIPDVHYKVNADNSITGIKNPAPIHWAFSLVKHGQLNAEVKNYLSVSITQNVISNLDLANAYGRVDTIRGTLPFYPDLASFNLDKIVSEYEVRSILGTHNIDSTWNDYVTRWRTAGGDKAIQFWTEWYDREGKNVVAK